MTPAVVETVALSMVLKYLAGLRGFNPQKESQGLFVRTIQDACVSVSHAEYVLSQFDDICPTPREIKDVAFTSRERFLPQGPSQKEQWEKQYGPPDKSITEKIQSVVKGGALNASERKARFNAEYGAMRLQSLKDAVYYSTPEGQYELSKIAGRNERDSSRAFWAHQIQWLTEKYPEQITAIRGGREPEFSDTPRKLPESQRITAESFRGVEPMRTENCTTCGGSGRLAGDDYCEACQTGRDLRRQEWRTRDDELAARAKSVLDDPQAAASQKEIAREILRGMDTGQAS